MRPHTASDVSPVSFVSGMTIAGPEDLDRPERSRIVLTRRRPATTATIAAIDRRATSTPFGTRTFFGDRVETASNSPPSRGRCVALRLETPPDQTPQAARHGLRQCLRASDRRQRASRAARIPHE